MVTVVGLYLTILLVIFACALSLGSTVLLEFSEKMYIPSPATSHGGGGGGSSVVYCNCRSKLVSQLTNGQLNSKCDDTKAYVDLYRFIKKTGQSASHNSLWQ